MPIPGVGKKGNSSLRRVLRKQVREQHRRQYQARWMMENALDPQSSVFKEAGFHAIRPWVEKNYPPELWKKVDSLYTKWRLPSCGTQGMELEEYIDFHLGRSVNEEYEMDQLCQDWKRNPEGMRSFKEYIAKHLNEDDYPDR